MQINITNFSPHQKSNTNYIRRNQHFAHFPCRLGAVTSFISESSKENISRFRQMDTVINDLSQIIYQSIVLRLASSSHHVLGPTGLDSGTTPVHPIHGRSGQHRCTVQYAFVGDNQQYIHCQPEDALRMLQCSILSADALRMLQCSAVCQPLSSGWLPVDSDSTFNVTKIPVCGISLTL